LYQFKRKTMKEEFIKMKEMLLSGDPETISLGKQLIANHIRRRKLMKLEEGVTYMFTWWNEFTGIYCREKLYLGEYAGLGPRRIRLQSFMAETTLKRELILDVVTIDEFNET